MEPSTETMCGVSDDTPELSSSEEDVESGGKPGEADASFDTEDEQHAKTEEIVRNRQRESKNRCSQLARRNDERVENKKNRLKTDSATGKIRRNRSTSRMKEQVTTERVI